MKLSDIVNSDPHWVNLPYPLRPCPEEVEVFKQHIIPGKVLLLGSTYDLLPLCTDAIDLVPKYEQVRYGDWYEMEGYYNTIIADGVFSWGYEELLEKISMHCDVFICRVFSKKFPTMKYATHFYDSIPEGKRIAEINESCPIFKWTFTN